MIIFNSCSFQFQVLDSQSKRQHVLKITKYLNSPSASSFVHYYTSVLQSEGENMSILQ